MKNRDTLKDMKALFLRGLMAEITEKTIKNRFPADAYLAHWQNSISTYFSPSKRTIFLLNNEGEDYIQLRADDLWRLLEVFESTGLYKLDAVVKPKTILFAEDDSNWHELLASEVEANFGNRAKVICFLDGKPAYEFFKKHVDNVDLTISCILMPELDGIKLLRMCKELRPSTPYIIHTAYDYRDDFAPLASEAYIVKSPANLPTLIDNIRRLLNL